MTYSFLTSSTSSSPQSSPIPGRQSEMVQGRSGGYGFTADTWSMLRRYLLLGTSNGSYYADRRELSEEFVEAVKAVIAENPERVSQEIVYASDGHSVSNSAPILDLVLLSMGESAAAKRAFEEVFPLVIRTASHFYEWIRYTKDLRGMGKIVRSCGEKWLSNPDVKWLAYQLLKYGQRHGFSRRDLLRLFHVRPPSKEHQCLYHWAVGGWNGFPPEPPCEEMTQIWWHERLKHPMVHDQDLTLEAIAQGRLTHEMVAPIGNMNCDAWQLLFEDMPIGATLRNLGSLSEIGVLRFDQIKNLDILERRLLDKKRARKARIHPLNILSASKVYASGGRLGRSQKTWSPVSRIMDILEKMLENSFEFQEPTGKVFLHAIDVSGSMQWSPLPTSGLTCSEIAATLALATAKVERNYAIRGFSNRFIDLEITSQDSFRSALNKVAHPYGSTDASVAYQWAITNKIKIDVFCFWTDCESWDGLQHPAQALAEYRRKVNPNAKAIYTTLQSSQVELSDPKDPNSFDFAGFDPSIPKAIQEIAGLK